jgi:hypothetical protein
MSIVLAIVTFFKLSTRYLLKDNIVDFGLMTEKY